MATAVAPPENGGWRESSGEEEERCVERTTSEQECDLMLEALCRELGEIKVSARTVRCTLPRTHRSVCVCVVCM